MKKYIYLTIVLIGGVFLLNSCDEAEYGEWDLGGKDYVAFDSGVAEYAIDPSQTSVTSVDVPFYRLNENSNSTVGISIEYEDASHSSVFQLAENTVTIAPGQRNAKVKINYTISNLVVGVNYKAKIKFNATGSATSTDKFGKVTDSCNVILFLKCPLVVADFVGTGTCSEDGGAPSPIIMDARGTDSLTMKGFFGIEAANELAGYTYRIPVGFDAVAETFSFKATDMGKFNVGLGFGVNLRVSGASNSLTAPIVGTYNACEKRITFSYYLFIYDSGAGAYNGYPFGKTDVVIHIN